MIEKLLQSELVADFIFRMTSMTFYPMKFYFMFPKKAEQIFATNQDFFFLKPFLSIQNPILVNGIGYIFRISENMNVFFGIFNFSSASITARSSILLLVVKRKPSEKSFFLIFFQEHAWEFHSHLFQDCHYKRHLCKFRFSCN